MRDRYVDQLGEIRVSWRPGSLVRDANAGKSLPFWFMPVQVAVVFGSLFGCLGLSAYVYVNLLKPLNLSPGLFWGGLVFVALFIPPMILLNRIGQALVNRRELAIHEEGVRWASRCIGYDQIDALSMGTKTYRDTHFPTLNKVWQSHWRYGEDMKKAEELEKRATLAFHLKDGTVQQWRNLGQCFPEDTMELFFVELSSRLAEVPNSPNV